jgi:hypothetical protein
MKPLSVLLLCASCLLAQDKADVAYINKTFLPAVALLYSQDEAGDMKMRCTATAIGKTKDGYEFVSAAHCGCEDDTENHTVSPEKTFFFITTDGDEGKEFLRANLTGCGYRHAGDDFSFFSIETKEQLPTVALGSDPQMGDRVVNVASPLGLGRQAFFGTVSSRTLNRPVVVEDINWTGVVLLQMFGVNGGSSGSAVVCLDQKAICSVIVGSIDKTSITAMPVSRLLKVRKALADGKYKPWVADPDSPTTKK